MTIIIFILFLLLIASSIAIDFSKTQIEKSCYNAATFGSLYHSDCSIVTWNSGHLYTAGNFSYYNPGTPLTTSEQLSYAQYLSNRLSQNKNLKSDCAQYLNYFTCIKAFPNCPITGTTISSVSYFQPCKLQCQQVNARCNAQFTINCDEYPENNCALYVASSYFILDPIKVSFILLFLHLNLRFCIV